MRCDPAALLFNIGGSYVAARLAPSQPMMHAVVLGVMGLAANTVGAVATWGRAPALGHEWYPLALVALAMPTAWAGGRLREMQWRARVDG